VSSRKLVLTIVLALALAGCRFGGAAPSQTAVPTPQPSATLTPAATPTPPPTDTPAPTLASATATALATATASPIAPASSTPGATTGTPLAGPSATAATQAAGTDKADFVADVTVPDGTTFTAGQAFVKTWKLKNSGTNTWTSNYALVFVRGDQMGGPASVPLSGTVAPGATTEVSLSLTAPNKLGTFIGFWMLRNAAGKLFGISADANQPVYLKINVGAAAGTPLPTAVPGAITVTAVTLSVDQASFTGACPRTYTFSGTLTSSGAGTVSYRLEASSDKPGFVFALPAAVNSTFTGAGPRTFSVSYQLQFTGSVGGQAVLHVLTPNDLSSTKVSFSLTCQP
jgi:hypothetical protein